MACSIRDCFSSNIGASETCQSYESASAKGPSDLGTKLVFKRVAMPPGPIAGPLYSMQISIDMMAAVPCQRGIERAAVAAVASDRGCDFLHTDRTLGKSKYLPPP